MRFSSFRAAIGAITFAITSLNLWLGSIAAQTPRDGPQLRIQLSASNFRAGDPIPIRLTLVNQSPDSQYVASLPPQALVKLYVYNNSGDEVRPIPRTINTMIMRPPRAVPPGGKLTLRSREGEWLDLRDWGYDIRVPGKYTITTSPRSADGLRTDVAGGTKSTDLTITIEL
jgi:hypothetical protein